VRKRLKSPTKNEISSAKGRYRHGRRRILDLTSLIEQDIETGKGMPGLPASLSRQPPPTLATCSGSRLDNLGAKS
jgi:hypothetical protein